MKSNRMNAEDNVSNSALLVMAQVSGWPWGVTEDGKRILRHGKGATWEMTPGALLDLTLSGKPEPWDEPRMG